MPKQHLKSLDVLRACCALMVMANHLYNESGVPQYSIGVGLVSFASEAVVGFFVLSGCLISLQGYTSIGRYVEARLVRILPIYYVLLIFSVLAMLACGAAFTGWNFAANALFIQTLNWDLLNPVQFYVQSWSLSYELWYYAAFIAIMVMPRLLLPFFFASIAAGIVVLLVPQSPGPTHAVLHAVAFFSMWLTGVLVTRLWQRGYSVSLATGVYMLAIAVCLSKVPLSSPAKFDFGRLFVFGIGFAGLVSALLSSAFGAFGGKSLRTFDIGPLSRVAVSVAALAILWIFSMSHTDMKLALTAGVVIFTISPAAMVRILSPLVRPTLPFLVYVGGLSYALYLVHYPLLQILNVTNVVPPIVKIFVVVVVAFGLAHLLDYKFQPWIRSRLRGSRRSGKWRRLRREMKRRKLLQISGGLPLLSACAAGTSAAVRRSRPGDATWPSPDDWQQLDAQVGGRLVRVQSPLDACRAAPAAAECGDVFRRLKNPWYIGDNVALTQTSGWVDAWTSTPSAYAVAARTSADAAAAVNFARTRRLRLVVKGGGHSYQGTSNAPDSLLVWTRPMDRIELHDGFVGQGCSEAPQPAVSIGAGTVWLHAYAAVTRAGRYVQGGGCTTVNVAGLVQSGGYGSLSKGFGSASAGLLEAEVVTADGRVRIANACTESDLFWALKGGGGGSFGVVTRVTLRTRPLPNYIGGMLATVQASSPETFRRLIERFVGFYRSNLFNPHWGEIVQFRSDNIMVIAMVFQGLDRDEAAAAWQPFFAWLAGQPGYYRVIEGPRVIAVPAQHFWDAAWLKKNIPQAILSDDRPGAPADNIFWRGNLGEAGWFVHGYESAWMPASLLEPGRQTALADALFAASRQRMTALHFNKGLAGAAAEDISAARNTATNPSATEAFALAITAAEGPPAFVGMPGHEPDLALARRDAQSTAAAIAELRKVAPDSGAYLTEASYFQKDWQQAFWGPNYPRLRRIKAQYDPEGVFFIHHGVGSEDWSADGFARVR